MTQEEKDYKEMLYNQYLGQGVIITPRLRYTGGSSPEPDGEDWVDDTLTYHNIEMVLRHSFPLWLTPISAITDEHALQFAPILHIDTNFPENAIRATKQYIERLGFANLRGETWEKLITAFRKNGYAYQYDGKSVEEQVKLGYIKLKES